MHRVPTFDPLEAFALLDGSDPPDVARITDSGPCVIVLGCVCRNELAVSHIELVTYFQWCLICDDERIFALEKMLQFKKAVQYREINHRQ